MSSGGVPGGAGAGAHAQHAAPQSHTRELQPGEVQQILQRHSRQPQYSLMERLEEMAEQAAGAPNLTEVSHAFDGPDGHHHKHSGSDEEAEKERRAAAIARANVGRGSLDVLLLPQPAKGSGMQVVVSGDGKDKTKGELQGAEWVELQVTRLHKTQAKEERRLLVDYAMRTMDQDNGPLLQQMHDRFARVGLGHPTVEVRFNHLNVDAKVTVGERGMPTVLNFFRDKVEALLQLARVLRPDTRPFNVLHGVSGVLKPGRLTLLLGPPSSGKTTLLKVLAGMMKPQHDDGKVSVGGVMSCILGDAFNSELKVTGSVTYNGEDLDHFQVRRTAAYVEQVDTHLGELTVRETFDFAAQSQGTGYAQAMYDELRRREKAAGITPDPVLDVYMRAAARQGGVHSVITDVMLRMLGLEVCADTPVGGPMVRGVSGGQRKRVTTGEMLVGPQRVLMLDEISTGLDSSTTRLITQCLRNLCHTTQTTALVALLQPPPEVYDLFDDVMLLSDGRVVYHGPTDQVIPFFESLGFALPERKGVADFLQEVTSRKDQAAYWARPDTPHTFIPVQAMVEAFEASPIGRARAAELAAGYKPSSPAAALTSSKAHHAVAAPVKPADLAIQVDSTAAGAGAERVVVHHNGRGLPAHNDSTWTADKPADSGSNSVTSGSSGSPVAVHAGGADTGVDAPAAWGGDGLQRSVFALSGWQAFKSNLRRDYTLMTRMGFLWGFKTFQALITGVLFSTLFVKSRMGTSTINDASLYLGIIFYSITHSMFNGYVEMSILVQGLRIFFKQRDGQFFPSWAYTLPPVLLRIPFSLLDGVLWSCLVYWITGMAPSAGRFFIFFVYMVLMSQMALALFRALGALARNYDTANSFGSTALILLLLLSGFVLTKPNIHPWWIWAFWMSPITYVQQALSINELKHPRWSTPVTFRGEVMPVGLATLKSYGLFTDDMYVWLGILVVLGYTILFQVLAFCFLTWFKEPARDPPTFSEQLLAARHANITGEVLPVLQEGHASPQDQQQQGGKRRSLQLVSRSIKSKTAAGPVAEAVTDIEVAHGAANGSDPEAANKPPPSVAATSSDQVLSFRPLSVAFKDIKYTVDMPPQNDQYESLKAAGEARPQLALLKGITGSFRPGVLTALMGVSGAGKTTLMDVLAGRKTVGTITGQVLVDGHTKVEDTFARVCGYVEQADIHVPRTTVREALQISARLRLPRLEHETLEAWVDEVMDLVELGPQAGALVGLPGQWGLSVEQRKRLTIGVELVANPSVVFMDEPTSGLDARAAAIVMRAVRNTVNTGRTVVCTIHQPSIDIFESFDELLLLKQGGRTIYHGPLGEHSSKLITYFQSFKGVAPCPKDLNPATWMLEMTTPAEEAALGIDFADGYEQSELCKYNDELVASLSKPSPDSQPLSFTREYSRGYFTQFRVLLERNFRQYWRNTAYNGVRYMFCTILGLLLGSIYWNLGTKRDTPTDLFNVLGALFICITFLGTYNANGVLPALAAERPVFYRERAAKMYAGLPYAVALGLVEIPYVVVQTILYGTITYFMIQFEFNAAKFFWYLLFVFLTLLFFTFYGFMIVAVMPIIELSSIISAMFYSIWFIWGGFFVSEPNMPPWWRWFYWLDPLSYALYGIIGSQLSDVTNEFVDSGDGSAPQSVASYVKSAFNFKKSFVGAAAAILAAFILFFWFVFVMAVTKLNHNRR